jgi:hypothetical protein
VHICLTLSNFLRVMHCLRRCETPVYRSATQSCVNNGGCKNGSTCTLYSKGLIWCKDCPPCKYCHVPTHVHVICAATTVFALQSIGAHMLAAHNWYSCCMQLTHFTVHPRCILKLCLRLAASWLPQTTAVTGALDILKHQCSLINVNI